jgi:hypothetical protein
MTDASEIITRSELPPPLRKGRAPNGKHMLYAAHMRENPGLWVQVAESRKSQTTSNMRAGKYAAFPKGEFEFESRKEDGIFVTWARKPIEGEK